MTCKIVNVASEKASLKKQNQQNLVNAVDEIRVVMLEFDYCRIKAVLIFEN